MDKFLNYKKRISTINCSAVEARVSAKMLKLDFEYYLTVIGHSFKKLKNDTIPADISQSASSNPIQPR